MGQKVDYPLIGQLSAVAEIPSGSVVELHYCSGSGKAFVTGKLFPSIAWVKEHLGRWVNVTGKPGGAKLCAAPHDVIHRAINPKTGASSFSCGLCHQAMGRLMDSEGSEGVRAIGKKFGAHLLERHPEIVDSLRSEP